MKGGVTPVSTKRKFQSAAHRDREVWSVAHKYRLPLLEVQRIVAAISSIRTDSPGRLLSEDELNSLIGRIFDIEDVPQDILTEAKVVLDLGREVTLDTVVSWYVQNMFKHVAGFLGTKEQRASDALVYDLAKKLRVKPTVIDRIKREFDQVDQDGNGTLEQNEFERMLYCIFHAKDGDLSESRLRHFWREIDVDNDGLITFPEYAKWHLKYFDTAQSSCNLVDSFYDSFNPRAQLRNNLHVVTAAA
jgi:hypothetical protein